MLVLHPYTYPVHTTSVNNYAQIPMVDQPTIPFYNYTQPPPPMAVRVDPDEMYDFYDSEDEDYYIYPSESESEYEDYEMFSPVPPVYNPEMGQIIRSLNDEQVQVMSTCVIYYIRQPVVTFLGCLHQCVCKICIRGLQITAAGERINCPLCNVHSGYVVGKLP